MKQLTFRSNVLSRALVITGLLSFGVAGPVCAAGGASGGGGTGGGVASNVTNADVAGEILVKLRTLPIRFVANHAIG